MIKFFRSKSALGKSLECVGWLCIAGMLSLPFIDFDAFKLPRGYEQVLPRGRIVAVNCPDYVKAEEATVADDTIVLGIVVEGQPLAYSLNLLNSHEVINDTYGNTHFTAVW